MASSRVFIALRALPLLGGALITAACSTAPTRSAADDDCARWFAQLDAAVDATGARDAQERRIDGYPGLRVDRFGAATKRLVAFDTWLERAAALDRAARDAEIANLPRSGFPIDGAADAGAARARSERCRATWRDKLATPAQREALLQRAVVPDDYSTARRVLGFYALTRVAFLHGAERWQHRQRNAIEAWAAAPPAVQRFVAAGDGAPVFEVETRAGGPAADDRFGVPTWDTGAATPRIDNRAPTVYVRDASTLVHGRVLAQRVYTLWFPERPRDGPFDLLAGAIDGVIVRLTYAPDGTLLMLDTIHACGCYEMFFPADGVRLRADAPADEEPPFVPAPLPAMRAGERLVVRIASGTHQVSGVARDDGRPGIVYTLHDEGELRSLPLPDGSRRSFYRADGLVAGSERSERLLFWPMGIESAGAMRQWGHHATAFVGRRHFDDADLIERRFTIARLDAVAGATSDPLSGEAARCPLGRAAAGRFGAAGPGSRAGLAAARTAAAAGSTD